MLKQLDLISGTALEHPHTDLHDARRSSTEIRSHPVWDYCRDNIPRIIVWKLLKLQLNLEHDLKEDQQCCLLRDAEYFDEVSRQNTDAGSYLVWGKERSIWIRTGKAVSLGPRQSCSTGHIVKDGHIWDSMSAWLTTTP